MKHTSNKTSVLASAWFRSLTLGLSLTATLAACAPQQAQKAQISEQGSSRIVNGVEIGSDDVLAKSTVAIAEPEGNEKVQFCSGTLIAKNVVVTAGHCGEFMQGLESSYVLFGLSEKASVAVKVAKVVMHEGYNNDSGFVYKGEPIGQNWNDLALLLLEEDAPAGYVPAEMLLDDALLADQDVVTLAGYGLTSGGYFGTGAGVLRKTDVKVAAAKFSEQEFVTDEAANGSCNGDSGGPVYLTKNGKTYVVGATSRGDRLCKSFGVYTALARFQPWISSVMTDFAAPAVPAEEARPTEQVEVLSQLAQALIDAGIVKKDKTLVAF